jgi:hypothetical protein
MQPSAGGGCEGLIDHGWSTCCEVFVIRRRYGRFGDKVNAWVMTEVTLCIKHTLLTIKASGLLSGFACTSQQTRENQQPAKTFTAGACAPAVQAVPGFFF